MILLHPRHISVLHALHLLPGASSNVHLAAILLSVALGYCAYTDIFRGRIIPNAAVLTIAFASLASVPLIFSHSGRHLFWAGVAILAIFVVLYLPRAMAAGDIKLLAALTIIFAQGTLVLVFVAIILILVYGLPHAFLSHGRAHKRGERAGMTKAPGAPGIALSYPVALYFAGAELTSCLILVGLEVATALLCLVWSWRVAPWLEEKEEGHGEKEPVDGAESLQ